MNNSYHYVVVNRAVEVRDKMDTLIKRFVGPGALERARELTKVLNS